MGFVDVGIIFEHFISLQVKMFLGLQSLIYVKDMET